MEADEGTWCSHNPVRSDRKVTPSGRQRDVIVLGSGIAGLSVADAAVKYGKSCTVIDIHPQGRGASAAPAMLINPAAGKRARRTWRTEPAFKAITGLLKRVEDRTGQQFYEIRGVIRPALTEKMAEDFQRTPFKYEWDEGWLEWMDREAFALRFPYLRNPYGGLFIHQAATVAGAQFNAAFVQYLESYGVHFIFGSASQPRRMNDLWQVRTDEGVLHSPLLIDASGVSQTTSPWWEHLPLHPVKGQTVSYKFSKPLPLDASVSGMGYLAFLSTAPYELTVGSTYEHHFDHPEPDREGMKAIGMKLEKMLPGYSGAVEVSRGWSGVRVTLPDKQPVIGSHHALPGLYLIGAMGSKGLLLARYLADLLMRHILIGVEIPEEVSIRRYL